MKISLDVLDMKSLVQTAEMKPTVILICSALLLSVHRHFGSLEFAVRSFGSDNAMVPPLYMFAAAFLLMGIVPLAIVFFVFRARPADFGLRLGDWRKGLWSVMLFFPVIAVAFLYPGSQTPEMRAFYPYLDGAGDSVVDFSLLQLPRIVFFYTAWEFFFRGFMLFGLRRSVGDWLAVCIQTIPSCLWHIGMPTGELISSIGGGILFGVMALRTNSILWPFILHVMIGVGFDMLVVLQL